MTRRDIGLSSRSSRYIQFELQRAASGVTERDLLAARSEIDRRFFTLRDLLDDLGYTPRGLTARLPPEPSIDG